MRRLLLALALCLLLDSTVRGQMDLAENIALAAFLPDQPLLRLGSLRFEHPDCVSKLAFSPDDRHLLAVWPGGAHQWTLDDGQRIGSVQLPLLPWVHAVPSPDGTRLATAKKGGTVT